MAFLAAVPAWVGIASAAVSAGVGVYSAIQTKKAGQLQAEELKSQARTEGLAAKQREIERRRSLLRALSSQNAAAGAAGIETGGSFGAIVQRQIDDNANDLLVENANTSARQRAYASRASNAVSAANSSAAVSLLDTASKTYNNWPGK